MSDAERSRQIDELFRAALRAAPAERRRFVEERCPGDEALRDEVLALLDEDEATHGAIDRPALEQATRLRERHVAAPPAAVGPYRIVRLIGEGGFGSVYLAEQREPVRRTVALKIIKPGMDTKAVIARFEAERQALALMDHPNIARVHDAGATEQGRPYFVMEHVVGAPITGFCEEHGLDTARRLDLFLKVCGAVQHAHQKGVIHRDIKPSNVLVTMENDVPAPKLIDFGIAKAISRPLTERTLFTEVNQLVGTPEYMSPEQAGAGGLDVDTRTDIYSLGVLLYELLTGTTPFDSRVLRSASFEEIRRIIREQDPPRPSTRLSSLSAAGADDERRPDRRASAASSQGRRSEVLDRARQLRGDLDWIVMKAMEKDRTRRYDSAGALAADIGRHLRDEPVAAGPPGVGYRARKFVRRNRTAVGAVSLTAAGLLIGCALAIIGLVEAARERDRALAEIERTRAINAFFLEDLLRQAAPDRNPVGAEVTVRELLDRAAAQIDEGVHDQPEIEATILWAIADSYSALGLFDRAEPYARRSYAIFDRLHGLEGEQTLMALATLVHALDHQYELEEAASLYPMLLEASPRVLGPDHPRTLSAANNYAEMLRAQGRYEQSEQLHRQNMEARTRALGPDHPDTLESMHNLGSIYFHLGRMDDAERVLKQTVDARGRVHGEQSPPTMISLSNLGVVYSRQGKLAEAEQITRRVLAADQRLLGPEHPETLADMHNLAAQLARQEKLDEAEALYREVVELRRRVLGADHPDVAYSLHGLGFTLEQQQRNAEAEGAYRAALSIRAAALPPGNDVRLGSAEALGRCLLALARFDEAERVLVEALEAAPQDASERIIGRLRAALVDVYDAGGRPEEADRWREPATGGAGEPTGDGR